MGAGGLRSVSPSTPLGLVGQQGLRVVDAPHLVGTVSPTKKLLLYVLLPLLLGTLLGGAFIVLRTVQDRTLRYPDEVWDRLGVPLLTVLPLAES